mmetsp:Transcript_7744/g.21733  ORF Transcript_7744/g.21733 Transcript_7744/m.21733 type:complete len:339 (-) Transcript_7744:2374-3390(-)
MRLEEPHEGRQGVQARRGDQRRKARRGTGRRSVGRALRRAAVGLPLVPVLQLVVDVVEQGLYHTVEDHAPGVLVEDGAAVLLQAIEDPGERSSPDVAPGVAHQHREPPEDGEPVRGGVARAGHGPRLRPARDHVDARQGARRWGRRVGLALVREVLRGLQQVLDRLQGHGDVGLALAERQQRADALAKVLDEEVVVLLDDFLNDGEADLHAVLVLVLLRRRVEDVEDGLPAGLDVLDPPLDHVRYDLHDEVLHVPAHIGDHHDLERPEEVGLEVVVAQLVLLQELHGQLPEGVDRVHADADVRVAGHVDEVLAQDAPNPRPGEADAVHVVVGHLHELL